MLGIGRPARGVGAAATAALGEMHRRRVRRMLLADSAVIVAVSTIWLVMFALHGQWAAALPQAVTLCATGATVALVWRGDLRQAS